MITWVGPFEGTGAYPTINRQLCAALERAGERVLRNVHNQGLDLTPVCVTHTYPLRPPNVRHTLNVGLAVWEFAGKRGVPLSFADAFKAFDLLCAPSEWVCEQFRAATDTPVLPIQWGVDADEFTPVGEIASLPQQAADADTLLLWIGGTDARHGFDVAVKVMDLLPDTYHLIAKQSAHYPETPTQHPRITVLRDDLPSLAPLMRSCDLLLHTARGVGFSLPVLEALACGLPVVSTDLPPVREYAPDYRVAFASKGAWEPMGQHHVHADCLPVWWEPDVEDFAATVLGFTPGQWSRDEFINRWSWDAAAQRLMSVVTGDVIHG